MNGSAGPRELLASSGQVRSAAHRLQMACGAPIIGAALRQVFRRTLDDGVPAEMQPLLVRLDRNRRAR